MDIQLLDFLTGRPLNSPMFRNSKAAVVIALPIILSSCGGSGEQTGATDLYGAYEVIEGGMSETQVKAVIGAEPDARQADGNQSQILAWEADPNTYRHITLLVTVHGQDGVTRKIITGYRGNKSQSY